MYEAAEAKMVLRFFCSMKCQPNHHPSDLERHWISRPAVVTPCGSNRKVSSCRQQPFLRISLKGALQLCTGARCGAPLRGGHGVGRAVKIPSR